MNSPEQLTVGQAALNELQKRAEDMNGQILRAAKLLEAGNTDRALSLVWLLQEANCKQIHGLIAAGAVDSAAEELGGWSTVPDDDEAPVDAEKLDLAVLRAEFGTE